MIVKIALLVAVLGLPFQTFAQESFLRIFASHLDGQTTDMPEYWQSEAAVASLRAAQAGWKPSLRVGGSLPGLTRQIEAILQDDGSQVFVPRSQSYGNLSMNLSQPIPWTGGHLEVRSGLYRVQNFAPWANISWQSLPVMVSLYQPIFSGRPLLRKQETLLLTRYMASRKLDLAWRQRLLALTSDWLGWIRARETYHASLGNLSRADSLLEILRARQQAGSLSVGEWQQAGILRQQARNRTDLAFNEFQSAESAFLIRWGCETCLLADLPEGQPPALSFREDGLAILIESQTTWLDYQFAHRNLDLEYADLRLAGKPQMSVQAGIGLNQTGNSLSESYQQPVASQYATVSLSWQVLDWQARRQNMEAVSAGQRAIDAEQARFRQEQSALLTSSLRQLEALVALWPALLEVEEKSLHSLSWHREMLEAGQISLESWFRAREAHLALQQDRLEQNIAMWQLWLQLQIMDPDWTPLAP